MWLVIYTDSRKQNISKITPAKDIRCEYHESKPMSVTEITFYDSHLVH